MSLVVLHVGMPKTGSTTLQHTFDQNSEFLSRRGVLFPRAGRVREASPAHHALFYAAASNRDAVRTPLKDLEKSFEELASDVQTERKHRGSKNIILSSEMLWNPMAFDTSSLLRIRRFFCDDDFCIISYLRPIEDHILSSYAQRVTGPQMFDGSFAEHCLQLEHAGVYDFQARLQEFSEVFGRDAVHVAWLPWLRGDVLAPFRTILPSLTDLEPCKPLNERKSWFFVAAMRRLNCFKRLPLKKIRRPGKNVLRVLEPVFKKNPRIDKMFAPTEMGGLRRFQDKTELTVEMLKKNYTISDGEGRKLNALQHKAAYGAPD